MATAKFNTIDEYIAALPSLQQQVSKQIRQLIRQSAPQLEEGISYNMPVFKLNGKDLIWFAAWKEHISIYPRTAALDGAIKELADYDGEKGTIKFPLNKPFPFELVKKILRFKLSEKDSVKK